MRFLNSAGAANAKLARRDAIARRVLAAAGRGISPIGNVMASPPTLTVGGDWANSTIITGSTTNPGAGRFNSENPLHATPLGGPLNAGYIQTQTFQNGQTPPRRAGHSSGVAFVTRASVFDICIRGGGGNIIVYVTDMLTRQRARIAAADIAPTSPNDRYYKWDIGSTAMRGYEIYSGFSSKYFGINVPLTDSIWPFVLPDQPKILIVSDSYDQGVLSDTGITSTLKLGVADYFAERLGCNNPMVAAIGGTGTLNPGGGPNTTYGQRIAAGDFDVARIGNMDIVFMPESINDSASANAAYTDAAVQAAYTAAVSAMMVAQPNAIIVGCGPENTPNIATSQARYDACKAGFLAAASGDARMIYLDNSPSGENWMFPALNASIIGPDGLHPRVAGASYVGYRRADSLLAALQALVA